MATININPGDLLKYIIEAYNNYNNQQTAEMKIKNPATGAIETQRPISDWLKVQSTKQALAPRSQVGQVGQGWQSPLGSFLQQGGRGSPMQQLMTLNKLSQGIGLGSFLPSASAKGAEGIIGTILSFLALL